jgi:gliding motility-associated-like protein
VEATTTATQTATEVENEIKSETDGLGGSGPCEISFKAAVSDAAVYREWQISRSAEFDVLENSYSDLEFDYTFRDNGTTYVRFIANNAAGTCDYVGQTYEVFIGESQLLCPNAFSPQSSPGVNDEWRVSYKSIIKFECHIFNRWGKELYSSTNPAQGWDGKFNGKYVPAGVYYYVINAEGSDGVKYKRSGDINIINYNTTSSTSGETTE